MKCKYPPSASRVPAKGGFADLRPKIYFNQNSWLQPYACICIHSDMTHLQTVMRYKINRVINENFTNNIAGERNSHETIFQTLVEVFFFYDCCCTVNIHPVYLHFRSYIASIITTYTGRTFLRLQL